MSFRRGLIIITSTTYPSKMYADFDWYAFFGIKRAGVGAVEAGSKAFTEQMPNLIKLSESAGKDGAQIIAKEIAPAINGVAIAIGVGVAIHSTIELANAGNDIYNHFNPSNEKKARDKAACEAIQYYNAREKLMDCLLNKADTPRNPEGIPTACAEFVKKYRIIAGHAALNEMLADFIESYPV